MGIDPGLRKTGFSVIKAEKYLKVLQYGVIEGKGTALSERIYTIYISLKEILEKFRPEVLSIEKVFYGKNVRTLMNLSELRGAILVLFKVHSIPVFEYTPREIKQSLTGAGSAAKVQVAYMVNKITGIHESIPQDASDAIAAGICYLNRNYKNDR